MKVYAVSAGGLKIFDSIKQFESLESWIDEKWMFIATTKDFKDPSLFWEFPLERGYIVYTDEQAEAHDLIHQEYLKWKG